MGLSARIRRLRYVYGWRLRYWWLDTAGGKQAHVVAFVLAALVVIAQTVRLAVAALQPAPEGPRGAVVWWVVQLILLVVSAILSYVLRPKVQEQPEPEHQGPVVEDGLAVDDCFGEVWIEDEFQLAWKITGTSPIKSKGGKK